MVLLLDANISGRRIILMLTICSITLQIRRACGRPEDPYQRCIGQALEATPLRQNESIFHIAKNTSCDACPSSVVPETSESESAATRVIFLLQFVSSEILAILAGLLTEALRVTIVILDPDLAPNELRRDVLFRVPCKHVQRSNETLKVTNLNGSFSFDGDCWRSGNPLAKCTLDYAADQYRWIDSYLQSSKENIPDLLLMDPMTTSGILISESWLIPSVVVPTQNVVWLSMWLEGRWTNERLGIIGHFKRIIRQRSYSFSLTRAFLRLNNIRRDLGLTPLKTPGNYFDPVAAIIVLFGPSAYPKVSGKVVVSGPFVAPCIPCDDGLIAKGTDRGMFGKILVAPSGKMGPAQTKALVRGLAIARKALEDYDDCEWDSLLCHNTAIGFRVIWMDKDSVSLPRALPSFVTVQNSTSILDTYARNDEVFAVVAHCNSDTEFLSSLGVTVVCISHDALLMPKHDLLLPPGESTPYARDIAAKILRFLRSSSRGPAPNNRTISSLNTLPRIVSLIKLSARVKRSRRREWTSFEEMKQSISTVLRSGNENQPYDTFTVLVAWMVLIASGSYIILKDPIMSLWRPRRGHRDGAEGILSRLADLDDAYATFLQWFEDQPAVQRYANKMTEIQREQLLKDQSAQDSNSGHSKNDQHHYHHHGHNHHLRRRRKR